MIESCAIINQLDIIKESVRELESAAKQLSDVHQKYEKWEWMFENLSIEEESKLELFGENMNKFTYEKLSKIFNP